MLTAESAPAASIFNRFVAVERRWHVQFDVLYEVREMLLNFLGIVCVFAAFPDSIRDAFCPIGLDPHRVIAAVFVAERLSSVRLSTLLVYSHFLDSRPLPLDTSATTLRLASGGLFERYLDPLRQRVVADHETSHSPV
jgi:hypothetical protein